MLSATAQAGFGLEVTVMPLGSSGDGCTLTAALTVVEVASCTVSVTDLASVTLLAASTIVSPDTVVATGSVVASLENAR